MFQTDNRTVLSSDYGLLYHLRFGLQGLVESVGVSNYGPQQLAKIAKYLKARDVPLVTAQVYRQGSVIDHSLFPDTLMTLKLGKQTKAPCYLRTTSQGLGIVNTRTGKSG